MNEMFWLAKGIVDGSKHFRHKRTTRKQIGFSQDFSDDFARPLIVVRDNGTEMSADKLLHGIDMHWMMERVVGNF